MRTVNNCPIGIFDSGVGGLTVFQEIHKLLPQESILYFADNARLPYGNRSSTEILQFVREILTWMSHSKVKIAIMACNTSSALALEAVRKEFSFPILGVVLPGARAAAKYGRSVGVISTLATAKSDSYRQAIQEINPDIKVWQIGCPELVPLIERDKIHDFHTQKTLKKYINPLLEKNIDTLIYGCTHYKHLEEIIKNIIPYKIELIDPAYYVAQSVKKELEIMSLRGNNSYFSVRFVVTGSPKNFSHLSKKWLGYYPLVDFISLSRNLQELIISNKMDQKN
ncbi:glutamate racemase [Candidatus Atelocyanobacterium thalassae]|uniref:Glutamate racemase n=2 Tax=Candidatus Atelocyanobacterium thalassae TaxID=713887 RepID=A0A086CGW7_9CHRO|nr:glutamate racemase [Candidatus Atelocyanobacterium thalassa]KFF41431.1 MAG: glutamate racemase [Candidatus Atelocyanobacterium thalassa isolate SIO64986]BDA39674.1 glutamate racemase [cyanobacterium endosymbiont of Braarudosphaera bigelowii]